MCSAYRIPPSVSLKTVELRVVVLLIVGSTRRSSDGLPRVVLTLIGSVKWSTTCVQTSRRNALGITVVRSYSVSNVSRIHPVECVCRYSSQQACRTRSIQVYGARRDSAAPHLHAPEPSRDPGTASLHTRLDWWTRRSTSR